MQSLKLKDKQVAPSKSTLDDAVIRGLKLRHYTLYVQSRALQYKLTCMKHEQKMLLDEMREIEGKIEA